MSLGIDQADIEFPCPACGPACGYGVAAQLVDVRTQVWRWCPCCRVRIRLVDSGGSVSGAVSSIEEAVRGFGRTLKGMFE